jgi:hypothetical protein
MPRVGFEHTISALEPAKTFHTLDRSVTVIGFYLKTETESSLRNVVFKQKQENVLNKAGRWIMSRNIIFELSLRSRLTNS